MQPEQTMPADHTIDADVAPLWSRLVVGASILATGVAAGIAAIQHFDVERWLAWTIGIGVALAFAAVDQVLHRSPAPKRPKMATADRRAPKVSAPSARPMTAAIATDAQAPAVMATAPAKPTAAHKPLTDATFDQHVQHLQTLVREMAQATPGPKARTADPDGLSRLAPPAAGRTPSPAKHAVRPTAVAAATSPSAPAGTPRIAEAIAAERIDVLLESIQSLGEGRARHFEVSVRFRDAAGVEITDRDLFAIARKAGLAPRIDALKLPRVARVARKVQQRGGQPTDVLAGVAGPSLADHGFMEAFASAMTGATPPPLVLSFAQADVRDFARIHWSALATLAEMGVRFALTDVTDVDMDMDLLRARGFSFVKLDAGVFLEGLPHASGIIPARDICRHFETAGLALIVARVDADQQLAAIRALQVPFAQGAMFGGARKVRADVLADAA